MKTNLIFRLAISLILLSYTFPSFSQTNANGTVVGKTSKNQTGTQANSSIDFMVGIEYAYRHLKTSSTDNIIVGILENRDLKESGKFNWRMGVNYNRKLISKLFLKTGLRLASIGYKGEKRTGIRWPSENNGGIWVLDPSLPHEIQVVDNYWFLEIPVAARIEFSEKKWNPFFELGLAPSVYLTTKTKTITDIDTSINFLKNNHPGFNKVQLAGFVSMGLNYTLNEKLQLFGQPIIRYHLTKLVNAPIKENLFNYGMEIGIRKKLT